MSKGIVSCKNCVFYKELECRLNPPIFIKYQDDYKSYVGDFIVTSINQEWAYPMVDPDRDGCGQGIDNSYLDIQLEVR